MRTVETKFKLDRSRLRTRVNREQDKRVKPITLVESGSTDLIFYGKNEDWKGSDVWGITIRSEQKRKVLKIGKDRKDEEFGSEN